jgi:hypothetical protein
MNNNIALTINEELSQDTLYQDYRYLIGVYNNHYLEIMHQIEDLRREASAVRETIGSVTLDMRNRVRELRRTGERDARMENTLGSLFNVITGRPFSPPRYLPTQIGVPSPQHINDAIRIVRHGDLLDRETHDRCPISWAQFEENEQVTQIIQCGHVFKSSELARWFRTSAQCPICRYDIRTYRREEVDQNQEEGAEPQTNNGDNMVPVQIRDVSGNLIGTEMTNLLNWAHGLI